MQRKSMRNKPVKVKLRAARTLICEPSYQFGSVQHPTAPEEQGESFTEMKETTRLCKVVRLVFFWYLGGGGYRLEIIVPRH